MHYRNGREAKNGDKVVQLSESYESANEKFPVRIVAIGILYDAKPGNNFCNGYLAPLLGGLVQSACLCDCIHIDDLAEILTEKGLDKRPKSTPAKT